MTKEASAGPQSPKTFLTDEPIRSFEDDLLDRARFAQAVATSIEGLPTGVSSVVGLYGGWGEGKTSVLNMVFDVLKDVDSISCARFNPWRYQGEDEQLRFLFQVIGEAADANLEPTRKRFGKWLRRMSYLVQAASWSAGTPGAEVTIKPADSLEAVARHLEALSVDQLRDDLIGRALKEQGRRIVILIDDVDRLDRHEVRCLMRLLKLTCNFHNTCYLLACDEEMVASAIGEQYGTGDVASGRAFLEKIVQLAIPLPAPDRMGLLRVNVGYLEAILRGHKVEVRDTDSLRFWRLFRLAIEPECQTIRHGKRYANSVAATFAMIGDEVNWTDFFLIEGMRLFYPRLYAEVRRHYATLVEPAESNPRAHRDATAIKELVERGTNGLSASQADAATRLVTALFPLTEQAFGGRSYDGSVVVEWTAEKRVASKRHVSRYFAYRVPLEDVSDAQVQRVIGLVQSSNVAGASATLRELMTDANAINVLQRLSEATEAISGASAGRLSVAIAHAADKLSYERAIWFDSGDIAARMVRNWLRRIPPGDRVDWIRQVLSHPTPLLFALECARGMLGEGNAKAPEQWLSESADNEMRRLVVDRVESELNRRNGELPQGTALVMFMRSLAWWGDESKTRGWFRERISARPDNAMRILLAYAGHGTELETGYRRVGSLHADGYQAIARIVTPDAIIGALETTYGSALRGGEGSCDPNISDELRLAREFVEIDEGNRRENEERVSGLKQAPEPPPLGDDAEGSDDETRPAGRR